MTIRDLLSINFLDLPPFEFSFLFLHDFALVHNKAF